MTAGLATIPVTALAEGFEPPSMSCMKKINGWWGYSLVTAAALVAADRPAGVTTEPGVTSAVVGTGVSSSSRIRAEEVQVIARDNSSRENRGFNGARSDLRFDTML